MQKIFAILIATVLLCGCAQDEPPTPAPDGAPQAMPAEPAPELSPGQKAMEKARGAFYDGNTNGAITALSAALEDMNCKPEHPMLLRGLLDLLLMVGREDEARERFLAALGEDASQAGQAIGMIAGYYSSRGKNDALVEWTGKLAAMELPDGLAERAAGQHLKAMLTAGKLDELTAKVPQTIKQFGANAGPMLDGVLRSLMQDKKLDMAAGLLATIRQDAGDIDALKQLVTSSELRLAAAKEDWPQVADRFIAAAGTMEAPALAGLLPGLVKPALEAGQFAVADRIVEHVLDSVSAAPAPRERAASLWVQSAEKQGKLDLVGTRLADLRKRGLPAAALRRDYSRVFYRVFHEGGPDARKNMLELGDWLLAEMKDTGAREQVLALLMDGAVLADDYKRALKILKDGFRSDETEWHTMAVNKVEAHLALQEGRKRDAVNKFREFMEHVKTWTDATTDPSTGMRHTREMSLGFNAKRIGEILTEMGEAAEAAKAYGEARDYYQQALDEAEEGSKEAAHVKAELARLPTP